MASQWEHALGASKSIGSALGVKVEGSVRGISFAIVNEISIGRYYSVRESNIESFPWLVVKLDKDFKETKIGAYQNWSTAVYQAFDELLKEIINGCISIELEAERLDA